MTTVLPKISDKNSKSSRGGGVMMVVVVVILLLVSCEELHMRPLCLIKKAVTLNRISYHSCPGHNWVS